jgi:glycosyltransferase involved in cell wall biosynthesis
MVRILYDHQKFSEQKYGGITRYFAAIMQGIKQHADFEYQLSALYSNNYYIRNERLPLNNAAGQWLMGDNNKRRYKWNKWYSKRQIANGDYDVFHPTYFHPYFLKRVNKPFVLTMHDMIYEVLPEYFTNTDPTPHQKKQTAERATAIIAISESTKKDLIHLSGIPAEKIRMIYHGLDADAPLLAEAVPNLPENFILFVGERGNYKNFFRFAEAAADILHQYKDLHLVLAGGGPLQIADTQVIDRLKIGQRTHQFNVSDAQLNYLYQQAMVFVFPSLYEGFGYPILEAFKAGCPITASNTSCFPEIGGDAIAYFNPYDSASIYNSIASLLTDSNLCSSYIKTGSERLKLFPVQKQVQQTLDLYREVATK